jgi:hypothetical protein
MSYGTVPVLSVRNTSPVIWRPLGIRTVSEGAKLAAMKCFNSPTTIATYLLIITNNNIII